MARIISTLLGLLVPLLAHAQINPCPVPVLPCGGGGSAGVSAYLGGIIFPAVRVGFIGLATIMFTAYAARLLFEAEEESTVTEVKNAYTQAAVGAVIISVATLIVDAFGRSAGGTLINPAPIAFAVSNVIGYFKLIVAALVSVLVVTQGARLIALQGEEAELEQQKKKFLHSLLGVAAILLANTLVNVVQPGNASIVLAQEIRGAINFVLEILMVLAVLSFMIAGVLLVVSADEAQKDRAKKIVFGTVIALIIVLAAYAIINYFLLL